MSELKATLRQRVDSTVGRLSPIVNITPDIITVNGGTSKTIIYETRLYSFGIRHGIVPEDTAFWQYRKEATKHKTDFMVSVYRTDFNSLEELIEAIKDCMGKLGREIL